MDRTDDPVWGGAQQLLDQALDTALSSDAGTLALLDALAGTEDGDGPAHRLRAMCASEKTTASVRARLRR